MVHFGPFWSEEVHFGPFRSAKGTLAIPDLTRVHRKFFSSKCFLEGFLEGACKGLQ